MCIIRDIHVQVAACQNGNVISEQKIRRQIHCLYIDLTGLIPRLQGYAALRVILLEWNLRGVRYRFDIRQGFKLMLQGIQPIPDAINGQTIHGVNLGSWEDITTFLYLLILHVNDSNDGKHEGGNRELCADHYGAHAGTFLSFACRVSQSLDGGCARDQPGRVHTGNQANESRREQ